MFQQALWLQSYKQGKYFIWLFWITSFYTLSYKYYLDAAKAFHFSQTTTKKIKYYYQYFLSPEDHLLVQGIVIIALACVLIGWERHNQTMESLWSMPFKRRDIFLTKWLLGVFNIIAVYTINWGLFTILKKTTFHNKYQLFSPFHSYFLYTAIVLIAIYTLALFMGTITANIFSQSVLTGIMFILPYGLALLFAGVISVHLYGTHEKTYNIENQYVSASSHVGILSPIEDLEIRFDYDPQSAYTDENGKRINEPNFSKIPSAWNLLSTIMYILVLLPLGTYLYTRSPNEQNGKLLLFSKLHKPFIVCTVACFALFGGRLIGGINSIVGYYIGFFLTGLISYLVLSRILKKRFSLGLK
ncbi:ABC transporter permease [Bacillus clarus]|uniref:ABC transporter permease n=1 Tax=Bacillus clarus TaxID=2338372 RepID=A0A090YPV8_9BACI|nr:ABC transporter permease subunit [Bacillus clarus]KFM99977.1 ABC-2 transporter family protein [Bacillus clarus]RFT68874.1 ABC transporter permease [Bacillus clarus]